MAEVWYEYIEVTQQFLDAYAAWAAAHPDSNLIGNDAGYDFYLTEQGNSLILYAPAGHSSIDPDEMLLLADYGIDIDSKAFSLSTQPHTPLYP